MGGLSFRPASSLSLLKRVALGWRDEDLELISAAADSAFPGGTLSFLNKMWVFSIVFLYTLLPGAKSTWHTSSFLKLCVL